MANPVASIEPMSFARKSISAGWAYPTPHHAMPEFVSAVFDEAERANVGAWGLQTAERPLKGSLLVFYTYHLAYC